MNLTYKNPIKTFKEPILKILQATSRSFNIKMNPEFLKIFKNLQNSSRTRILKKL